MNSPRIVRFFTRLQLVAAVLLISLVPSSIGIAQTDGMGTAPNEVVCPDCCVSECRTGWWYPVWQMCLEGGNGSCMHCETSCGIPGDPQEPTP